MLNLNLIQKNFRKNQTFLKPTQKPISFTFSNIKESKLFSILCRTNAIKHFLACFLPFSLCVSDTQAHIYSRDIFWVKIPALNSTPQNETFCFYYILTLVFVYYSIRYFYMWFIWTMSLIFLLFTFEYLIQCLSCSKHSWSIFHQQCA